MTTKTVAYTDAEIYFDFTQNPILGQNQSSKSFWGWIVTTQLKRVQLNTNQYLF